MSEHSEIVPKKTNIFMTRYEVPEDMFTYALLSLIEHLNSKSVKSILSKIEILDKNQQNYQIDKISVTPQPRGDESRPDGHIEIKTKTEEVLSIFIENKTQKYRLSVEQIRRHLEGMPEKSFLLVITTNKNDEKKLENLDDPRIKFVTWDYFVKELENLANDLEEELDDLQIECKEKISEVCSKDIFLLRQFAEYTELSDEVWLVKMIDKKLIDSLSKYVENYSKDIRKFKKDGERLLNHLADGIANEFRDKIKSATIERIGSKDDFPGAFGRYGVHCDLHKNSLKQWVFFGIYYDDYDHKIKLKEDHQPEYAVFLDMGSPEVNRIRLEKCEGIRDTIEGLKKEGFEFNFPEDKIGNPYRICYWHEQMKKYVNKEVSGLLDVFKERLKVLFESEFYKKLEIIED